MLIIGGIQHLIGYSNNMALADFLGVRKFGQGIASTIRNVTGQTQAVRQTQLQTSANQQKLLYAARQEQDPEKRRRLLNLAHSFGNAPSTEDVDPGLKLSNREILGSAANVGLNIAMPGAFRGKRLATMGKNVALGGGFGAASGLEQNQGLGGVVGKTIGGGIIGAGIGGLGLGAKVAKDFFTKATPKWLMDKAIKPTLDEARKGVKFGQKSFGEELLQEGVRGNPQKLLQIAETKSTQLENQLQKVLNDPTHQSTRITKSQIKPYVTDLVTAKRGVPGMKGDVQRIEGIVNSMPEQLTIQQANMMKRRIYDELRDVAYKLDPKLGTKAQTLKQIARGLKQEIEKAVGGTTVKDINYKLSLYGRLENRIVDQMARSMRNNGFGLTDAILTAGVGGGAFTLHPLGFLAGFGAAGIRRGVGSTAFRTGLAQTLKKGQNVGEGVVARTAKNLGRRTGFNIP
jgi:hypothetical protein